MQHPSHHQAGWTLIEMVIAISLVSVMSAALVPLGSAAARAHQTAHARLKSHDKMRYSMERMARELRELKYDAATGFAFVGTLTNAPTSQVTFTRIYGDATGTASAAATLQFLQSGTQVRLSDSRYPGVAAQVLCDNVATLQFSFLDQAGQVLGAPNAMNVYSIEIALTFTSAGSGLSQKTRVELKNRQNT